MPEACAEPTRYVIEHWWQIGITCLVCGAALFAADEFELNRPWPFALALSGILSFMILEAFPCAGELGWFGVAFLWSSLGCMSYFMVGQNQGRGARSPKIWDYFEEVDSSQSGHSKTKKGASPWIEW